MSRAEYQRAYRAARRAQRPDHICEGCGETFAARRKDARFCSAACRAASWRPIIHHAVQHQPDTLERCQHETGPGRFCGQPAAWRHDFVHNHERHLIGHGFYCDDHVALHHPDTVNVGESIHEVLNRDGREARARHGREDRPRV